MWSKFPRNRRMDWFVPKAYAGIALAALLLSGCSLLPMEEEPLRPPLAEPARVRIDTVEVTKETLKKSVTGTGILESVSSSYHQFTTAGYRLEEMLVSAGDEVKRGDPLIRLDVPGLDMEMLSRNLEVERKQQALEEVKAAGNRDKIKLALMELQLAEMAQQASQEKWDSRELYAQIDGVVTFADRLEPGDWVDAYRTLVIVSDPSKLQLSLTVSNAAQVADVELGMDAHVKFRNDELAGKVVQTPRSAPFVDDERLRTLYARTLYIDLAELPAEAKIGDMANVEIITSVREDVLTIPKNALRQYFGRTYVQVLDGEQRKEVDVQAGLEGATRVEIVNGLEEGQIVIQP